jgi:hypothetical protein
MPEWSWEVRAGARQEHDRADFWALAPISPLPLRRRLRESGMNTIKAIDADGLKVPSAIPQDLLLIHDLVGGDLLGASSSSQTLAAELNDPLGPGTSKAEEDDTDSIASSSGDDSLDDAGDVDMLKRDHPSKAAAEGEKGADSEEEVEAGLLDGGEGGDPMTM